MAVNKRWIGNIGTAGDYSVAANWSPSGVPLVTDHVRIPAGSYAITAGLNQSAVALGSFIVEQGYAAAIAGLTAGVPAYLQVNAGRFEFAGSAAAYIDLGSSACSPRILETYSPGTGLRGLYLKGSALAALDVLGGSVGIAVNHGEASTLDRAHVAGGSLWLGAGVVADTLDVDDGEVRVRCDLAELNLVKGGTVYTEEDAAIDQANVHAGTFYPNASGILAACDLYGGTTDFKASSVERTVSALTVHRGRPVILRLNREAVTYTALSFPDSGTVNFIPLA